MRRLAALFVAAFVLCGQSAITNFPPGAFASRAALDSNGATYTGPGDIATFEFWYGLRAFSSADRGQKLVNVCNVSDVACADWSSDATTGALVISTVGGSSCAIVTCTIKTWYDRSGNANNVTQATIGNRFTLNTSCVSSLPCAVGLGTSSQCYFGTNSITQAQPYTTIYVADRTGAFSTQGTIFSDSADQSESGFHVTSNKVYIAVTAAPAVAGTNSAFHAVQNVFTGAASTINVDTTTSTVSPGTLGWSGKPLLGSFSTNGSSCITGGGQFFTGNFVEGGMSAGALSAGNQTTMNSNIHTYWGF